MPYTLVIFGASGDLTQRKLIPSLYQLFRKGRLKEATRIVGFSRTAFSHESWRTELARSTAQFLLGDFDPEVWSKFAASIFYHRGDIGSAADFAALRSFLDDGGGDSRIYYLATAPQFYEPAVAHLGASGLADESQGVRRIIIEKPFGYDLASARQLNEVVHRVFAERQVYRIDHYLGKETVQNMLVLRFANSIFEPIWNRNYIDHVQITTAEKVTVGRRGAYYEQSGVVRDMFQNHLLQLMTMTAMEPPSQFEADAIRNEKVKVLESVRPFTPDDVARDTVRAQYMGYRGEPEVAPDSQTPTFAALKLHVDNWRWHGVPFYLRSGKAMDCRTSQIVIQFRQPPLNLFSTVKEQHHDANRLVVHIQPAEGIQIHFQTKVPDAGMQLRLTDLDFRFDTRFAKALPEAYERLLLDTLMGDASLFARSDEVELAWGIIDPILQAWQQHDLPPLAFYEAGAWGPRESQKWMWKHNRDWLDVCPVLK